MVHAKFELAPPHLAKARRCMQEIRRAVEGYWYATMEGTESAAIEVRRATSAINILDEAVFSTVFGEPYHDYRAADPLGKTVMGLELIRNCEEHAPVIFEGLLVEVVQFSVPTSYGGDLLRSVYRWASWDDMPSGYVNLDSTAPASQRRARKEAQDGYRKAVERRLVMDTLFDALRFFSSLDPQLAVYERPQIAWAFAESLDEHGYVTVPTSEAMADAPSTYMTYRPMGMDQYETFLPDIACRPFERRSARWPAWDLISQERKTGLVQQAKNRVPPGDAREVQHVLVDDGRVIGYSGRVVGEVWDGAAWVERTRQIARDVDRGYRYFAAVEGEEVPLEQHKNLGVRALTASGDDALAGLVPAPDFVPLQASWLKLLEEHPDLYLRTRPADGVPG